GAAVGVEFVAHGAPGWADAEHGARLDAAELALDGTVDALRPAELGDLLEGRHDDRLDHPAKHLRHWGADADGAATQLIRLSRMQDAGFPVLGHGPPLLSIDQNSQVVSGRLADGGRRKGRAIPTGR